MDTDSSSSILPSSGDQQNNAESCTDELSTAESVDSNKTNIDQDFPMLESDKHQDISISSITVDLSDKSENTDGYPSSCDTDAIGITAHDDNLETNDPCNEDMHTLNKLCSVSNDQLSHIKSPLQQDSSTKTVTESQDNTFLSQVSALNLENISSEPDSLAVLTHKDTSTSCSSKDPSIRIKMLARVAVSDAHFKHQQRGEPDLTMEEKIEIAQNILDANPVTFLSRFHNYLELEDVDYFKDLRDIYEVDFYCKQIYKSKSGSYHKNCVKNRRYEAMKQLISEGDYFSEEEMKFREPYLYDQMIGRFLSDEEVQAKVDKADLRFSSILIRHIDILDENVRFAREKDKEESQMEEEEESDEESELESDTEKSQDDDDSRKTIPDREKLELKEEFMTIMQERFLSGHDKNFDYSKVDNNEKYDDLDVLNRDAQEKYFDDEDCLSIHSMDSMDT